MQTFAQLRAHAQQERAEGRYLAAARLERQAAERAGALGRVGERQRALLWEGYSLRQAGEDDLALALLLQTVSAQAATTDPADGFAALVAILHLSLDRKPVAFCRALLEQARRQLVDLGQPWTAALDYVVGELAYRRGDWAAAWDRHCRAWAGWRDAHPRLTAATHVWALARTAFRRRDVTELARWTAALVALHPGSVLEQQLVRRARLLTWRAQRLVELDHAAPVELAVEVLTIAATGTRDFGARAEALRVLALAGCWEAIDAELSRQPLPAACFESALLLGDLALHRARAARRWPPVDDDYGEQPGALRTGDATPSALLHLQTALALGAHEDARLETTWHRVIVQERLQCVA
ncbi:MAG: hypothetical protein WAT67_00960 [Candidatus Contendobacter sp.]